MKILLIKFRNIGDVLLSTPLIENLKHYYPESKIDFALNIGCEDMVIDNPNIDNVIIYDRYTIKKKNILFRAIDEYKFFKGVSNISYDIVINLTEGDRGAILALLSRAKIRLGFPVRNWPLSMLNIFHKTLKNTEREHTVKRDLRFVELLEKKVVSKKVNINWSKNIESDIENILIENDVSSDYVHIHPVSRWMFKCWDDEKMAKIIDYFIRFKGMDVVITGSKNNIEIDRINKILELCKFNPINLTGKLNLRHLAYLSSKAKLFFGVDTAPMHIAAAVDTPVLALFGATFPEVWGPWNNNNDAKLFYDINGKQFNQRHMVISNTNHEKYFVHNVKKTKGMSLIDLSEVKKAINKMLFLEN